MELVAFLLNIGLYSLFPLYFTTLNSHLRLVAFYCYISIVLLIGGVAGAIYSFPLSDTLQISGGNLAYGAFMMSTVMLIIIAHDVSTFRNMIRLVVMVDFFVFVILSFLTWILESGYVLNPLHTPSSIFSTSLLVLILGGILILSEILLLLFFFLQVRKRVTNLSALALIYTVIFIVILCADGILFPLLAFGIRPDLVDIMFGNVTGKFIIALCYSLPMLIFFFVFRRNLTKFLNTPLTINELIIAPRKKLLETLSHYEIRDKQLQRDKQELKDMAEKDALTALANRHKFEQSLASEWSRCQREGKPLTLVIGDIDFFKQYNDTYGHQKGDVCIQTIGLFWSNIFTRSSDIAARIGGEEFAIILPNMSVKDSLPSLQRFLMTLKKESIPHGSSAIASHVTMSIGVAECIPKKELTSKNLFAVADQRLYRAKQNGRNQIVFE